MCVVYVCVYVYMDLAFHLIAFEKSATGRNVSVCILHEVSLITYFHLTQTVSPMAFPSTPTTRFMNRLSARYVGKAYLLPRFC